LDVWLPRCLAPPFECDRLHNHLSHLGTSLSHHTPNPPPPENDERPPGTWPTPTPRRRASFLPPPPCACAPSTASRPAWSSSATRAAGRCAPCGWTLTATRWVCCWALMLHGAACLQGAACSMQVSAPMQRLHACRANTTPPPQPRARSPTLSSTPAPRASTALTAPTPGLCAS
jgi:hypothetical protein